VHNGEKRFVSDQTYALQECTLSNHLLNESGTDDEILSKTHSFIIKLWLEEFDRKQERAVWRGHITHVAEGKRRYVQHIDDIISFIVPYLEEMGVRCLRWKWLPQWLSRLRILTKERTDEENDG
jgi:hypothetical protein